MTSPETAALLRLEVGRLRRRESRPRFDTVVHVGRLDGPVRSCSVRYGDPVVDAGTRVEVVLGLLAGLSGEEGACAWLTRAGEGGCQDEDLAWLAASTLAFGAVARPLEAFWSLTRSGWVDVRTGESRTWKRLRIGG